MSSQTEDPKPSSPEPSARNVPRRRRADAPKSHNTNTRAPTAAVVNSTERPSRENSTREPSAAAEPPAARTPSRLRAVVDRVALPLAIVALLVGGYLLLLLFTPQH